MSRNILLRFVPPAPIKIKTGKDTSHIREWDGEKMAAFLQEGLEIWAGDTYPDFEMKVAVSRQAEIRWSLPRDAERWTAEAYMKRYCLPSVVDR